MKWQKILEIVLKVAAYFAVGAVFNITVVFFSLFTTQYLTLLVPVLVGYSLVELIKFLGKKLAERENENIQSLIDEAFDESE